MAYELSVLSDTAFENLIAEIRFDNGSSVVVSQEHGFHHFETSIYSPHRSTDELEERPHLIDLDEFLGALAEAKERLILVDVPRN